MNPIATIFAASLAAGIASKAAEKATDRVVKSVTPTLNRAKLQAEEKYRRIALERAERRLAKVQTAIDSLQPKAVSDDR